MESSFAAKPGEHMEKTGFALRPVILFDDSETIDAGMSLLVTSFPDEDNYFARLVNGKRTSCSK